MSEAIDIPVFTLFGETENFPDVVHYEDLSARAPKYGWKIVPHRHNQMAQLFLIRRGAAHAMVDSESYELESNSFLFVPTQCVHGFSFAPGTTGSVISFPSAVLASIGPTQSKLASALANPLSNPQSAEIQALNNMIAENQHSASKYRTQKAVGLSHTLLSHIAEFSESETSSDKNAVHSRVDAYNNLIKKHLADGWTITDYALALSISPGHLTRICKKQLGLSASRHLDQTTMEEACRLLAFTHISISEIGYRLGFGDPSYFAKRFRAVRGETPTRYRQAFQT